MAYKQKTAEERAKEIEDLTAGMEEKINSYFVSPEKLQEHLEFMSTFHKYSIRNMTLIDKQFQGARAVGSFQYWKEKGASVQKGEKGIKILVPTPVQYFSRNNKDVQVKFATADEKKKIANGTIPTEKKLFFKVGHVFEYTQTNAREKGLEVSEIFSNYHRDGSIENDKQFMQAFEKIADKVGVELLNEPPSNYEFGTAKGGYFRNLNAIALNPRNTMADNIPVMIHELAHADLHSNEKNKARGKELSTNEKEFQAEMVAYTVGTHYGIEMDKFSVPYLAGWTKDATLEDKTKLLTEVKNTASEFIEVIDEHFHEIEQVKEQLNERALLAYERENEPQLFIHDVSTEFENFGKVNNLDFQNGDNTNVIYAAAFMENDKLQVVHADFDSEKYAHPLHHMKNENLVSPETYKTLEDSFHKELLLVEGVDQMGLSEQEQHYEDRLQNELGKFDIDYERVSNMDLTERIEYFTEIDQFDELLKERQREITDGIQDSPIENENKYNHTMKIKSLEAEGESVDVDLLATIEITNGLNGKVHELAVWASDGENRELEPYYVYMNSPRDLEVEDTYEGALSSNLIDSQLFQIVKPDDEIETVISDYHDGTCNNFEFSIPNEDMRMGIHEIVVDEELADILIKSENNLLEKSDLVDFGKLTGDDSQSIDFSSHEDLKKAFDNTLSNSDIAKDEIPHLKACYESLNMKIPDDFSQSKKPIKREVEQALER